MEYRFKKIHTVKDLTVSVILIAAGAGIFFFNGGIGITIVLLGILCLVFYKAGYKLEGHDTVFTKQSEDICKACKASIIDFLNGKDIVPTIKKGNEGGCVRLDIYTNRAEGIGYAQLHDFCNYKYEPVTALVELQDIRLEKLISQL